MTRLASETLSGHMKRFRMSGCNTSTTEVQRLVGNVGEKRLLMNTGWHTPHQIQTKGEVRHCSTLKKGRTEKPQCGPDELFTTSLLHPSLLWLTVG